jgi:hypothetical protein
MPYHLQFGIQFKQPATGITLASVIYCSSSFLVSSTPPHTYLPIPIYSTFFPYCPPSSHHFSHFSPYSPLSLSFYLDSIVCFLLAINSCPRHSTLILSYLCYAHRGASEQDDRIHDVVRRTQPQPPTRNPSTSFSLPEYIRPHDTYTKAHQHYALRTHARTYHRVYIHPPISST